MSFTFYLGCHRVSWLSQLSIPLFFSHNVLRGDIRRSDFPAARGPVAIDSGGYSELHAHGRWTIPARVYVAAAHRYAAEIGVDWLAVQDWMCEPWILAKTGLSVTEHQRRTIESLLELRSLASDLPWAPILQGWQPTDYVEHIAMYADAGIDLTREPIVGLGSVCRRQATRQAAGLVYTLAQHLGAARLHGFGFKTDGLRQIAHLLRSADSLAWSDDGRRQPDGCDWRPINDRGPHRNEANCQRYALAWRQDVLDAMTNQQLTIGAAA